MADLLLLFGAVLAVSLLSLVGALTLVLRRRLLDRALFALVSFAAGSLLAAALLDLLPEAQRTWGDGLTLPLVLAGVIVFFVLEKFVFWYHCHKGKCKTHGHALRRANLMYTNLIGDGLHNFLDGMAIAASFLVSTQLGFVTTIAVILHEIPQEIGDFGVLIYSGLKPARALFYNFLSALTAFAGAIAVVLASNVFASFTPGLLAFTAGGFLYIAGTDLIPELAKEPDTKKSLVQLALLLLGVGLIAAFSYLE